MFHFYILLSRVSWSGTVAQFKEKAVIMKYASGPKIRAEVLLLVLGEIPMDKAESKKKKKERVET